ncbi:MAG: phosphatase PAP2 family protein [Candidatus Nanopelagicales bacterium]
MIRSLAIDDSSAAFAHAAWLIDLERTAGLLHEARLQDVIGSVGALSGFFDLYYMIGCGPLLAVSLTWLGLRRRAAYRELRTALLASLALASFFFVLYPTAPPRLVSDLGIADTVGLSGHDTGSFAGIDFNPYAAMPSMHVGWSLLLAMVAWRVVDRALPRVLIALHPVLMTLTVVVTGNHFLVDAAAGAAVALTGYALVSCRSARLVLRVRPARARRRGSGRCLAAPGA